MKLPTFGFSPTHVRKHLKSCILDLPSSGFELWPSIQTRLDLDCSTHPEIQQECSRTLRFLRARSFRDEVLWPKLSGLLPVRDSILM
jgi:hypothetical protein